MLISVMLFGLSFVDIHVTSFSFQFLISFFSNSSHMYIFLHAAWPHAIVVLSLWWNLCDNQERLCMCGCCGNNENIVDRHGNRIIYIIKMYTLFLMCLNFYWHCSHEKWSDCRLERSDAVYSEIDRFASSRTFFPLSRSDKTLLSLQIYSLSQRRRRSGGKKLKLKVSTTRLESTIDDIITAQWFSNHNHQHNFVIVALAFKRHRDFACRREWRFSTFHRECSTSIKNHILCESDENRIVLPRFKIFMPSSG